MKLTPHPILLSLSIRLLQVTVAISLPAAKGASKGRFSARIRSEGPHSQMQDFETGRKGSFSGKTESFFRQKIRRTSGRGLAVRFGSASWASLVISFCWQEWFYLCVWGRTYSLYVSYGWGSFIFCRENSLLILAFALAVKLLPPFGYIMHAGLVVCQDLYGFPFS